MNAEVQKINNTINQRFDDLKKKKEELRDLTMSIINKNAGVFKELKRIKTDLRAEFEKVTPI